MNQRTVRSGVVILTAFLTVLGPIRARAALVDEGLLTRDTTTGLRWLDLTESTSLSYNDVSTQFGSGGRFAGYRYATVSEVYTLFVDAGIPSICPTTPEVCGILVPENEPAVSHLAALVGATEYSYGVYAGGAGITADATLVGTYESPGRKTAEYETGFNGLINSPYGAPVAAATAPSGGVSNEGAFPGLASWLVRRSDVPEPATLALLGVGLAAMAWRRSRRREPGVRVLR